MSLTLLITDVAGSCFQSATVFRILFIDSLLLFVQRLGTHVWTRAVYNTRTALFTSSGREKTQQEKENKYNSNTFKTVGKAYTW